MLSGIGLACDQRCIKKLGTFAILELSTLVPMIFYSCKTSNFVFLPVRGFPLRLISLNVIFEAPIGRFHLIFVKTLRRDQILSKSDFSAAARFFRELLVMKIFRIFRGERVLFWNLLSHEPWVCYYSWIKRWSIIRLSGFSWFSSPKMF